MEGWEEKWEGRDKERGMEKGYKKQIRTGGGGGEGEKKSRGWRLETQRVGEEKED